LVNSTAVVLLGLLVFGAVFSTQITSWWTDFTASQQASAQAKALAPQLTKGITVCNLKIQIISQLTSNFFSPNPDNMNIITTHYQWMNCRVNTSSLSLIQIPPAYFEKLSNGYNNNGGFHLLDFALVSAVNIPVSIVLSNVQGQQYDSNLLPALTQNIHVPAGLIKEPFVTTLTYLLTNIPKTDYKVSASTQAATIQFGSSGQLPAGAPVSWQVFANQDHN
jgi:hypothetical protein